MSQYLIIFNHTQGFNSGEIHELITNIPGVTDWWHYLPNVYIVSSESTAESLANRIISRFQGLLFLIVKLDLRDYNGVLSRDAWEWIGKKKGQYVKLKAVSNFRTNPLPLPQLLSGLMPSRGLTKPLSLDELFGKR